MASMDSTVTVKLEAEELVRAIDRFAMAVKDLKEAHPQPDHIVDDSRRGPETRAQRSNEVCAWCQHRPVLPDKSLCSVCFQHVDRP